MKGVLAVLFFLALSFSIASASPPQYIQAPPLTKVVTTPVGEVRSGGPTNVFLITWGGDMATVFANGNSLNTAKGSIFSNLGLNLKLIKEDDFQKQIEMYLRGETPYLRGTMGMINLASELLSQDPRTKPMVIYQLTWSSGGDVIVVKEGIKTLKDLCGKTIALQAYGPHVDYMARVITDACGSVSKVNIKWTKDLVGVEGNTPGAAFRNDPQVSAAFVISPDAAALTPSSASTAGAEYSVKGARVLLSTKTANRIIGDIYVARSDYLNKNRSEVEKFTHGLMLGEEAMRDAVKNKTSQPAPYKAMIEASAEILLGSRQAVADAEGLYGDAEFVGYKGNVKFFGDPNYPRNLDKLTSEIQSAYITLKILSKKVALEHPKWDYNVLKAGLRDVQGVEAPRFVKTEVEKVVVQKQQQGKLSEGEILPPFEIKFQPNQNDFSVDSYKEAFERVVNLVSTYGGAVLTVEGHTDPLGYLRAKKQGIPDVSSNSNVPGLKDIRQSAKNLSYTRAAAVRDSVIAYAVKKNVKLDASQFVVIGHGFEKPKTGMCGVDPCAPKSEEEWRSNMRVEFRVIQIETEASVFRPLE